MGKCSRTNKIRPKRQNGIETVKQRRKRQLAGFKASSVDEVRVVRKRGEAKKEREPAGEAKKVPAWEVRFKALLKTNAQIGDLRRRLADGEDLDAQQTEKIKRRDAILLEIDDLVDKHPALAANFTSMN